MAPPQCGSPRLKEETALAEELMDVCMKDVEEASLLQLSDELLGKVADHMSCKTSFDKLRRTSRAFAHSQSMCQRIQHIKLLDWDKGMPSQGDTETQGAQFSMGLVRENAVLAVSQCPRAARPRKLSVASSPSRMASFLDELTRTASVLDLTHVRELHLHGITLNSIVVQQARRLCPRVTALHLHFVTLQRGGLPAVATAWPGLAELGLSLAHAHKERMPYEHSLLSDSAVHFKEISCLTKLQRLHLSAEESDEWDVAPVASLTALTHLNINVDHCYRTSYTASAVHNMHLVQNRCSQLASLKIGHVCHFGGMQDAVWPSLQSVSGEFGHETLTQLQLHRAPLLRRLELNWDVEGMHKYEDEDDPTVLCCSPTHIAPAFASLAQLPAGVCPTTLQLHYPKGGMEHVYAALPPLAPFIKCLDLKLLPDLELYDDDYEDGALIAELLPNVEEVFASWKAMAFEFVAGMLSVGSVPALRLLQFDDHCRYGADGIAFMCDAAVDRAKAGHAHLQIRLRGSSELAQALQQRYPDNCSVCTSDVVQVVLQF